MHRSIPGGLSSLRVLDHFRFERCFDAARGLTKLRFLRKFVLTPCFLYHYANYEQRIGAVCGLINLLFNFEDVWQVEPSSAQTFNALSAESVVAERFTTYVLSLRQGQDDRREWSIESHAHPNQF